MQSHPTRKVTASSSSNLEHDRECDQIPVTAGQKRSKIFKAAGWVMDKTTWPRFSYFFGNIGTFAATGILLSAVAVQSTFAQNPSHPVSHVLSSTSTHSPSSSSTHAVKTGASVGCSNHGLPCSSAPAASGPQASGTQSSQYNRQLSQIEHERVTAPKATSGRSSTRGATASQTVSHTGGKPAPPINFSYRAPRSTPTTSTKGH